MKLLQYHVFIALTIVALALFTSTFLWLSRHELLDRETNESATQYLVREGASSR